VRADARFMVPIPNGIASADAAPLLCAGTTVFSLWLITASSQVCGQRSWVWAGSGILPCSFSQRWGARLPQSLRPIEGGRSAAARGVPIYCNQKLDELQRAARSFDFVLVTCRPTYPGKTISAPFGRRARCASSASGERPEVPPFDIILPERRVVVEERARQATPHACCTLRRSMA